MGRGREIMRRKFTRRSALKSIGIAGISIGGASRVSARSDPDDEDDGSGITTSSPGDDGLTPIGGGADSRYPIGGNDAGQNTAQMSGIEFAQVAGAGIQYWGSFPDNPHRPNDDGVLHDFTVVGHSSTYRQRMGGRDEWQPDEELGKQKIEIELTDGVSSLLTTSAEEEGSNNKDYGVYPDPSNNSDFDYSDTAFFAAKSLALSMFDSGGGSAIDWGRRFVNKLYSPNPSIDGDTFTQTHTYGDGILNDPPAEVGNLTRILLANEQNSASFTLRQKFERSIASSGSGLLERSLDCEVDGGDARISTADTYQTLSLEKQSIFNTLSDSTPSDVETTIYNGHPAIEIPQWRVPDDSIFSNYVTDGTLTKVVYDTGI